jgi:hypothetical protein
MAILANTDFKNPYLIYAPTGNSNAITFFENIRDEYEEHYLKKILGVRTYNDYLDNSGNTFWTNFVDGVDYTVNSVEYKYPGIKPVLARFVFFHWHEEKDSKLVWEGKIKDTYEDKIKHMPYHEMVKQFNKAVDLIDSPFSYDADVYHYMDTQYTGDDWIYTQIKKINEWDL